MGNRLAVHFNDSLEQVARIQAEWFGQGHDFGFQPQFRIPALVIAESGDHGFGEMNDKTILGRLPVRLGLHVK